MKMRWRIIRCVLRIRLGLLRRSGAMRMIGYGAVTVLVAGQAIVIAALLGELESARSAQHLLVGAVNLVVVVVTLLRNLFPSYRPTGVLVTAFHPVKRVERAVWNAVFDLLTAYLLMAAGFFILLFTFASSYGPGALVLSLTALFASALLERSLRLVVEHRFATRLGQALVTALLTALLFFGLVRQMHPAASGAIRMVLLAALFGAGHHVLLAFIAARPAAVPSRRYRSAPRFATHGTRGLARIFQSACYRNRLVSVSVGIAFAVKCFGLGVLGWLLASEHLTVFPQAAEIAVLLLALPIVHFTYVLGNMFGHVPTLWHTLHMNRGDVATAWRAYLRLVWPPLLLDALLSIGLVAFVDLLTGRFLALYAGSLVYLTMLGFIGSAGMPVRIKAMPSFTRYDMNVSPVFTIIAMLPLVGATVLRLRTPYFIADIVMALLVVAGLLVITSRAYRTLKHRAYLALCG